MSETPVTKPTRYRVGETVLFIHIDFEPSEPRFSSLYLPWKDTLKGITIVPLVCKEHHRVGWDYTPEKREYDGFIFELKSTGATFYNQYPTASYGQIDDSADWKVSEHPVTEENCFVYFEDAVVVLRRIADGIRSLSGDDTTKERIALEALLADLTERIKVLGYHVTVSDYHREYASTTTDEKIVIDDPKRTNVAIEKM